MTSIRRSLERAQPRPTRGPRTIVATVRRRDGLRYSVVVDPRARDDISQAMAHGRGGRVSACWVDLMLAMVRPGDLVLDLGAHIGAFALAAAAAGCRVIAVEASAENAALLEDSARHNEFRDLRVIHAAVSDRRGGVTFCGSGPWGYVTPDPSADGTRVRALRVDDLLIAKDRAQLAFVKMDVEGSEPAALLGMKRLLSQSDAPPVLYESNGHCLALNRHTPAQLLAGFEALGYRNYFVGDDIVRRTPRTELQAYTVVNYLAVKRRLPRLRGWRAVRPQTLASCIHALASEAHHPHRHHRAYVARALAHCDRRILADSTIAKALTRLARDAEPEVRAAARWWSSVRE